MILFQVAGFVEEDTLRGFPRSPDINPLDSFLWDFVKDMVYKTPGRQARQDVSKTGISLRYPECYKWHYIELY